MEQTKEQFIEEARQIRNKLFRWTYESAAVDPRQWLNYARSLKSAADLLSPTFQKELDAPYSPPKKNNFKTSIGQIYLMMVGFSVENYLKGIYITEDSNVIKDDRLIKLNRHGLLQLMSELKFKLTKKEIDLVERLEEFVLWAGRYPIPTKFERLIPKKHREGTKFAFIVYSLSTDIEVASKLLLKLDKKLSKVMNL